jgi:PST family polysaccharide transporter
LGIASYYVLQSLTTLLMTAVGTGAVVRPRLDLSATREMRAEGARATGVRLTAVGFNYMDQLALGALVAPGQLGLFNLGKRMEVVAITIASSFGQLMFQPIFATADPKHRATHMGRGIAAISLFCGVPFVVLALYARLAVPFVFGAQWLPAANVVALLGLGGLARALGGVAGALLTATGRNAVLLKIGLWAAGLSVLLLVGLARFGVEIVAAGILCRNILFAFIEFRSAPGANEGLLKLFVFNCFLPLATVAVVSWAAGAGLSALIGVTNPVAIFSVLATAGLSGAAVGAFFLFPRI